MNHRRQHSHSIDTLFSLMLFGMFVIFILLLLVFSARTYKASVKGLDENNNLRTAAVYLTTKFRQHDEERGVRLTDFGGTQALCLADTIDGEEYVTYIYLQDRQLKELFTSPGSAATAEMGMPVAELTAFVVEETPEGFYQVTMEDLSGSQSRLLLHPGSPADEYQNTVPVSQS